MLAAAGAMCCRRLNCDSGAKLCRHCGWPRGHQVTVSVGSKSVQVQLSKAVQDTRKGRVVRERARLSGRLRS
jgi:hypothetical protein